MNEKVDVDILKYYQSCLRSYENASVDDKYQEALKAVASLNKNGIKVCYHPSICFIIEKFVQDFPTNEIIGCLLRAINGYIDGVINGKYTSRLLEKVLNSCQSKEIAEDEIVQFQSQKFCEYMWTHYPDYLENSIGSHNVRLFFQFVSGVYIKMEDMIYSPSSVVISTPMEENYFEKINDLINRFLINPQILQLLTNEYMSYTFQVLLVICFIRCPEKFKQVTKHIMKIMCNINKGENENSSNEKEIPECFRNKFQSFFLECFILMVPESGSYWKKFSKKYLSSSLVEFVTDIMTSSDSCGLFKAVVKKMKKTDTLLAVVQQIRISVCQIPEFECGNVFLKLLVALTDKINLFSSDSDQSILRSFKNALIEIVQFLSKDDEKKGMSLGKFFTNGFKKSSNEDEEDSDGDELKSNGAEKQCCSMWSSLLMQNILKNFQPIPKSINKLFTSLSAEEIIKFGSDARGSRTFDSFIKSTFVPEDIKIKFLDILSSEHLVELSCSVCGSRIMDTIFDLGNSQLMDLVRNKLESVRENLKSHKFGRFVERKFFGYNQKHKEEKNKTVMKRKITTENEKVESKNKKIK